jgi:Ca2+-binding RTX toxin-like protein
MANFYQYNGNKYLLTSHGTWQQAQAQAQSLGGNLVTINNQAEQDWLVSTFGGSENLWIGFTDEVTEGQFKWASGETSTYTNWSFGQPDNHLNNEDYVGMNFGGAGKWNDFSISSTYSLRGIIEIKNTINGGDGNDTLNGDGDVYTLIGGKGDDTYIVDSTTDAVIENANEGTDTIQSSVTYTMAALANVENLTLTGTAAINGTGNAANNIITGNSANNILDGGEGNDILNPGYSQGSTDTVDGGDGNDLLQVDYTSKTDGAGIHLGHQNTNHIWNRNGAQILVNVSNVENYNITGTQYDDVFEGRSGNDTFNGGAGSDTADYSKIGQSITLSPTVIITKGGGLGNDQLIQVETIIADASAVNNTIDMSTAGNAASISVNLQTQQLTVNGVPGVGTFTVTNFDNVQGTSQNDTIIGDTQNNRLSGNAGNDTLIGGAGNDTLDGGAGKDILIGGLGDDTYIVDSTTDTIIENANEGTDTIQSSVTYSLASLGSINYLTLTGTGAINGTGNANSNVIIGNNANNTLNGGAGNDTLDGGLGRDTLIGGLGDDTYIVDSTTDTIIANANEGTDTIQSSVTYSLASLRSINYLTLTGTGAINGTGNANGNVIIGNGANNRLTGELGKDALTGGLGTDRFDYRNLADSVLNSFDVITDFNATAGNDLFLVTTARTRFSNAGSVATLDTTQIAAKLTKTTFTANSAAQFSFGSLTFVAINDATAGFSATTDAIIEVTGLTGTLGLYNFTTTLA